MSIIRVNWKLINKIIFIVLLIILFYEIYDLFIRNRPALQYDKENRLFFIKSKEIRNQYKSVHIRCANLYYTKLNVNDIPHLLEYAVELKFNCIRLQLLWNEHEYEMDFVDFWRRNADLKLVIDFISSFNLYLILKIDPYHKYDSYCDFGGLPSWILSNIFVHNPLDLDENQHFSNFYSSFLIKLLLFLKQNDYFYDQNGPIIAFEYDLVDNNETLTRKYYDFYQNLFYKYSINELLLTSIISAVSINTNIHLFVPMDVYLDDKTPKFDKLKYNDENIHEFWGDNLTSDSRTTIDLNHMNRQIQVVKHMKNKQRSFVLNNFHCFVNYGVSNAANLIKNNDIYRYKPLLNYVNIKNCLINYNLKPTKSYFHMKDLNVDENETTNELVEQGETTRIGFNLTHYLNFEQVMQKFTVNYVNYSDSINIENMLFGKNSHFAIYHAKIEAKKWNFVKINEEAIRDYAIFMCDKKRLFTINRMSPEEVDVKRLPNTCLDFYVFTENMGRISGKNVNINQLFNEKKGILNRTAIRFGQKQQKINDWAIYTIDINRFTEIFPFNSKWNSINSDNFDNKRPIDGPILFYSRLYVNLSKSKPYYIKLSDKWTKGILILNEFTLGRYWTSMSQICTIYIPHKLILDGMNEIFVFEFESTNTFKIEFTNKQEYAPCIEY